MWKQPRLQELRIWTRPNPPLSASQLPFRLVSSLYSFFVLTHLTLQSYLPASVTGQTAGTNTTTTSTGTTTASSVAAQAQAGAVAALGTAKEYLVAAQVAAQPHIEKGKVVASEYLASAQETAQPHIEKGKAAAQGYLASAQETAQPHIEKGKSVAQGYLGGSTAGTEGTTLPTFAQSDSVPPVSTGIPPVAANTNAVPGVPEKNLKEIPASSTGIPAV